MRRLLHIPLFAVIVLLLFSAAVDAQVRPPEDVPADAEDGSTPGQDTGERDEADGDAAERDARPAQPTRPMLDVPVTVPQIPPRRGNGIRGEPPMLASPERARVAFVLTTGASMGSALPDDAAGAAGNRGRTRLDLALAELRPLIGILGEGLDLAFLEIDQQARAYTPAAASGSSATWTRILELDSNPRSTDDRGSSKDDLDSPGAGENAAPREGSPAAGDGGGAGADPTSDLATAFHELTDDFEAGLQSLLARLTASEQTLDAAAFAGTLRALVREPQVRQVFVIADSAGDTGGLLPAPQATPKDSPVRARQPRGAAGQLALVRAELAAMPVAERPRIHVLSLAPAGSADDTALESLARISGGVYLRRP